MTLVIKNNLSSLFKSCLDILRNNEHLTGDKALRPLSYLLIIRLIDSKIDNEINFNDYNYDYSNFDIPEDYKKRLFKLIKFSNLATDKDVNLSQTITNLWNVILAQHPKTKDIFLEGKSIDFKNDSTYKKIVDKLYKFDFESIEADIQGEAYEEVIKDVMTGKVLGQYFTPPNIKNVMINIIDPKVKKSGKIETIFDPAMGTGGFLISSIRHIIKQAKDKNIKLDWEFIINKGIGGREVEKDTYQLAKANMLISTGHMIDGIELNDSKKREH